jgi:hypothetical protein
MFVYMYVFIYVCMYVCRETIVGKTFVSDCVQNDRLSVSSQQGSLRRTCRQLDIHKTLCSVVRSSLHPRQHKKYDFCRDLPERAANTCEILNWLVFNKHGDVSYIDKSEPTQFVDLEGARTSMSYLNMKATVRVLTSRTNCLFDFVQRSG